MYSTSRFFFTPTPSNLLYYEQATTVRLGVNKKKCICIFCAAANQASLLLKEVQAQACSEKSVKDENLQDSKSGRISPYTCWKQPGHRVHPWESVGTVSMDFSAPLPDSRDHRPSPRPPVSPVCPPAVCHERPCPALWHCAPAPWPWVQQCCSLSVPL